MSSQSGPRRLQRPPHGAQSGPLVPKSVPRKRPGWPKRQKNEARGAQEDSRGPQETLEDNKKRLKSFIYPSHTECHYFRAQNLPPSLRSGIIGCDGTYEIAREWRHYF